jgi:predicted DNA-binding helix-hairpin-helix protein
MSAGSTVGKGWCFGADGADDASILQTSATLYGSYRLRRVYYSAFSPIPDASRARVLRSRRSLRSA